MDTLKNIALAAFVIPASILYYMALITVAVLPYYLVYKGLGLIFGW